MLGFKYQVKDQHIDVRLLRRTVLLVVVVAVAVNLLLPLIGAVTIPATVPGGISTYGSVVIIAPSTTVIFVYPDTTTVGKPAGMFAALFTDWVALGIPIGAADNAQYETVDTSTVAPLLVDAVPPLTGQPGATNMPIVTVGGVLVHSQVHYIETVSSVSPVYYDQDATNRYFKLRAGGSVLATMPLSNPGTANDYFALYTCTDASGNQYYVFYGFHYRGSQAATHLLLNWIQTGDLASKTGSYYVYSWADSNGDGIVNPSPPDTYTLVASG